MLSRRHFCFVGAFGGPGKDNDLAYFLSVGEGLFGPRVAAVFHSWDLETDTWVVCHEGRGRDVEEGFWGRWNLPLLCILMP